MGRAGPRQRCEFDTGRLRMFHPPPPLAVAAEQVRESPDRRRKDAQLDAYLVGVPAAMRAFGLDADAMLPGTDETAALPRQQLKPRVVHADQTQVVLPGRY